MKCTQSEAGQNVNTTLTGYNLRETMCSTTNNEQTEETCATCTKQPIKGGEHLPATLSLCQSIKSLKQ